MFKAEIVADSISSTGNRLTSFLITFPHMILAELNTHRMLSKNSASSRAIKFEKMLAAVKENPFIPIRWMKEHSGMQGYQYYEQETCSQAWLEIDRAFGYEQYKNKLCTEHLEFEWIKGCEEVMQTAELLHSLKLSKQMCNRLLEPYMWHTVLISGTEWENFFALRANEAAEIHMQQLAFLMLNVYNASTPKVLAAGEWHIPFIDKLETQIEDITYGPLVAIKVSTALCAQTSYTVVGEDDKVMNNTKLIGLHDRLLKSGHMSPFEHCAKAMTAQEYEQYSKTKPSPAESARGSVYISEKGWCGNYRGFIQYRKMLVGENKTDNRVIKHNFSGRV